MGKVQDKLRGVKTFFTTDWNFVRLGRLVKRGVRAAPSGTKRYLVNKVPSAKWIPAYNLSWLAGDSIAGTTVGIVLALQAVNLAIPTPGGISIQQTLLASWLPGFIYAIMGTSKNISVGPTTSSMTLTFSLMNEIGAKRVMPPQLILPALTMAVSAWFFLFGLLGLGFVFDLIPTFICIAVVMGIAIIVTTLQLPVILGLIGIPNDFTAIIPSVIGNITQVSGKTIAVSLSAIIFLVVIAKLKSKWGAEKTTRGQIARGAKAGSLVVVILLFTVVSGFLLKDLPLNQQVAPFVPPAPPGGASGGAPGGSPGGPPGGPPGGIPGAEPAATGLAALGPVAPTIAAGAPGAPPGAVSAASPGVAPTAAPALAATDPSAAAAAGPPPADGAAAKKGPPPPLLKLPFWPIFPVFATTLSAATLPAVAMAKTLMMPSFMLFIAMNIEHILVAKFFAHKNGYAISQSQEMVSLGVINFVNSLFGGVPVSGGDVTRSAVLGYSNVKSPLAQIFSGMTVLGIMVQGAEGLRYIPQAILAVIILVAVVDQQPPQALMGVFFKLSFADFVAFFLAMNVVIVAPPGYNGLIGAGLGFGFLVLYNIFRVMFKRPKMLQGEDIEKLYDSSKYEKDWNSSDVVPGSTLIMKPDGDIIFTNAERMRRYILDAAYLHKSGKAGEFGDQCEQTWENPVDSYVKFIRKRDGAAEAGDQESLVVFRPRLRMVILDMTSTTHIDSSALMNFELLKTQLRHWAGELTEFRFVGLNKHLKRRFQRAGWHIVDPFGPQVTHEEDKSDIRDFVFDSLPQAVRYVSQETVLNGSFEEILGMPNDMEKAYNLEKVRSVDSDI